MKNNQPETCCVYHQTNIYYPKHNQQANVVIGMHKKVTDDCVLHI